MKKLVIKSFFLCLFLFIGCNSNENEFLTKDSTLKEKIAFGSKLTDEVGIPINKMLVHYQPGTTETEKQAIRNDYGQSLGLLFWRSCNLNPNAENWFITETPMTILLPKVDPLNDEDDIENFELNSICN